MSESAGTSPAAPPAPPQPTPLAFQQLIASSGSFPSQGMKTPPIRYAGMVISLGGYTGGFGAPNAEGDLLPIDSYGELFTIFGTSYGGDGPRFALPDLGRRIAVGGSPGDADGLTLAMSYVIAAAPGGVPVGSVALFSGDFAPSGWLPCDGSGYSQNDYPELCAAIGTAFGGDGDTFAVPDLKGRAAVGAGTGPGLAPVSLAESVAGAVPGLGLTMMISYTGLFPPAGGLGAFPESALILGQVTAFAGPTPPPNWFPCDGRLLPLASYTELFSMIGGATVGVGDESSFALPDLRGRMMAGL
ncbi:MAG TPA: tail fiber protein [Allosphingosinicella sp.]|nr:tail fiber protein [Allosphingosinicella sp.]